MKKCMLKLKLLSNNAGYDLVFPSSYYVGKMAKEGMLQPLDHSQLSNFNQIPTYLLGNDFLITKSVFFCLIFMG